MAKKKGYKKKTIVEEFGESGGFGKYTEAKGGGTPRGGIWGGKDGRVGWENRKANESMPSGAHREDQPRTKDGKFTYNSANGKELSPASDPSRGKTVNPLLTGGENGIYIEDVKKQFSEKKGAYWDKYKGAWHRAGGEAIVGGKVKINANAIVDYAKAGKYVDDKFVFEKDYELETEMWKPKTGKHSKEEEAALAKANKNKESYVKDDEDAIAVAKKYKPKKKEEELPPEIKSEPTKPEVKEEIKEEVIESAPEDLPSESKSKSKAEPWGKSGKFTTDDRDAMIEYVKGQMEKMGDAWDPDFFTDDDIEELLLEKEKEEKK